ncbi:SURF1 family protein [Stakelama marina]|uniref:SURF1-like protein n=1 Tax=Stakelama marina TaxID=2826939 RepID=A0A8T4IHD6_9SPHN|nr:SURF1 family protein [Stakelama marina]MBR0552495.1 SURF1 family protein [Stakelama marina]
MKRVPILATVIVAIAAAAMVSLGVWQLHRKEWKEALLARYAANEHRPAIAFPRFPDDSVLFRKASGFCLKPVKFQMEGAGRNGFRVVALCRTGAEGPGMYVQLGVTHDPHKQITWKGGDVSGYISHAPDHRALIEGIFDQRPKPLMLIADTPPDGLAANPPPDLSAVPNNHLSYAVQWFIFAGLAVLIYALALFRRNASALADRGDHR